MIIVNPQGLTWAGPWKLPQEFVNPNWTTLSSGSAQEILESRGLLGVSRMGAGARVVERLPWRRFAGNVDLY